MSTTLVYRAFCFCDVMMTWAIKAVAEFYRYFYRVVDRQSPPTVILHDLSGDPGNPSRTDSLFEATASAADPVSGVDQDGYHFITWRWNGSSWEGETDWGACAGAAGIGPLTDGLYRIEARVENGAGDPGSSGYRYFYVDEVPPSGVYGVTITSCTVSNARPTPGRALTLTGIGGQGRAAGGDDMVKIVAGLRDPQGHWLVRQRTIIARRGTRVVSNYGVLQPIAAEQRRPRPEPAGWR